MDTPAKPTGSYTTPLQGLITVTQNSAHLNRDPRLVISLAAAAQSQLNAMEGLLTKMRVGLSEAHEANQALAAAYLELRAQLKEEHPELFEEEGPLH